MPKNRRVEYYIRTTDGKVIRKKDISEARKFVKEDKGYIKERGIERRVYKNVGKGGDFWEISERDTKFLTVDQLLNQDPRSI